MKTILVFDAFGGAGVPNNNICNYTWMCSIFKDVHGTSQGYSVIANTFESGTGYGDYSKPGADQQAPDSEWFPSPTGDLKPGPVVRIGIGTGIRGQFLCIGLDDVLRLSGIKAIGAPAHGDKLTCVY